MSNFHSLQYIEPYKQAKQLINLVHLLGNWLMNNCQNWVYHDNRAKQIRRTQPVVSNIIHELTLDQQVAEGDDKAILYAIYKNIRKH